MKINQILLASVHLNIKATMEVMVKEMKKEGIAFKTIIPGKTPVQLLNYLIRNDIVCQSQPIGNLLSTFIEVSFFRFISNTKFCFTPEKQKSRHKIFYRGFSIIIHNA